MVRCWWSGRWTNGPTTAPPAPPASPASTRRPLPSSRAEAILSKVRQPAKVVSVPVGLLEKAVQLGIQIWSYTKTVAWLVKYRAKYGSAGRQPEGRRGPRAARQLLAPCIKLDNCDGSTRPVFSELKAWPSLHFDGRPGASPFSVPSARQRNKKLARRLDVQLEPTARRKEDSQQKAAKKVRGYCEICNTDFENLEAHLVTDQHLRFVSVASNWAEVRRPHYSHLDLTSSLAGGPVRQPGLLGTAAVIREMSRRLPRLRCPLGLK